MCRTYDWIYYFKLPFHVMSLVEVHKVGQVRKQS